MLERQSEFRLEEEVKDIGTLVTGIVDKQTRAATASAGTTDAVERGAHGSRVDS